ncbi:hypothetical protein CYMTET_23478 [Cymbomonas tetramitiformis]|uniref:Uncharacterized protein n=1 Tax=Cymbomonas tetramitiformis TaxID=36881 RepID=A0AAE0L159_9CHLO|nr:hypothetical protein CYMTET_23478 [Cymbomonas tetramitiformis]
MNTLGISGSLGTALQKIGNSQGSLANSELFIALENSEESNPSYEAAESQAAFQTDEEEQIVSLLSQNLHSTLQLPSPFRVLTSELEQRQRQFTSGNFQDANDARDCLFRLQYLQQELARWACIERQQRMESAIQYAEQLLAKPPTLAKQLHNYLWPSCERWPSCEHPEVIQ